MLKQALNRVSVLLTAVLAALAVLLVGVRVLGLTPYTVESGSMEPQYPVGSLIYVQKVDPASVMTGQAITFVMNGTDQTGTHAVYRIDAAARQFYTHGIANIGPDGAVLPDAAPVPFEALLGRPVFCIPLLGYLAGWLSTAPGRCVIAALLLAALVFGLLPGSVRRGKCAPAPVPAAPCGDLAPEQNRP